MHEQIDFYLVGFGRICRNAINSKKSTVFSDFQTQSSIIFLNVKKNISKNKKIT